MICGIIVISSSAIILSLWVISDIIMKIIKAINDNNIPGENE